MPSNIATLHDIVASLEHHGERPAVLAMQTEEIQEWSFAHVAECSRRLAAGLRKAGLEPGMRAALVAPNRPEWMVACFGVVQAGGIPVLIDAQTGREAMARLLDDSRAAWVLTTSDLARAQQAEEAPAKNGKKKKGTVPRGTVPIFAAQRSCLPNHLPFPPRKWDCPLRMERRKLPPPARERLPPAHAIRFERVGEPGCLPR